MSYEDVKKHRLVQKQRIIKVMGGKCSICGYNKCHKALELHHINPEEKEFTFSKDMLCNSWEKLVQELKKCTLLCANCHREVHSDMLNYELKTSFIEENADKITDEIDQIKSKTLFYCNNCGKEVSLGNDRCPECYHISQRIVNRPEREELKNKIKSYSFCEISRQYNVSDNAIRKWCDNYSLPRTKKEINSYSDEEWSNI